MLGWAGRWEFGRPKLWAMEDFYDVVLVVIRENSGCTGQEIKEKATSWRYALSLFRKRPFVASALIREHRESILRDRYNALGINEKTANCLETACVTGYVKEDGDGKLALTPNGWERLHNRYFGL